MRRLVTTGRTLLVAALVSGAAGAQSVAPADLSKLSPAAFRDDELDLPYYLAHFQRLANAVALDGPRRGFIDVAVWRSPKDNKPYNARIMENVLALAYFYTLDRPWNPYRGDTAVRARLEAALDFWVRSESPDGRFSEYAPEQWSLAPTAFATKFMGETLRLLHDPKAPRIDAALLRGAAEADRRAIMATLTRPDLAEHGARYTNQFGNVWGGALAYLALYPDPAMRRALGAWLARAETEHQSPVGYFYEADGPDWGYDLDTHHSDFLMAWQYARGTDLARYFVDPTRRWYEWLGYNVVPEPGESALTLNRSIESRQQHAVVDEAGPAESQTGNPLAEVVLEARVLGPTRETLARRAAERRAALVRDWPRVDTLAVGEFRAFSPYAFLHRAQVRWYPTDAQRAAAVERLRPVSESRFTHQRVDARRPIVFSYVRRPSYYAAFTAGDVVTAQQRYGFGLLWIPGVGSVLQSQTGGGVTAWGTRRADTTVVYEAATFDAAYRVADSTLGPAPGVRDLPAGDLAVTYRLGSRGTKRILFDDRGVHVSVSHAGAFAEQLPLLVLPSDSVTTRPGGVELRRGGARFTVRWAPASTAQVTYTDERSGARRVVAVVIPASDSLRYDLEMLGAPP
ncbi:hypothetical protein J421_5595 (plasmid) [Gemmatirosa kalamazoonensis]|uniref:Heparinase II/III family protein n=1 Tax=Gemmatirosa kalamazoonensis TaxID=861299 RepID=W0RS33_9BACT|nr:LytR C-terminal domain-containing protein [Gemmatirosa kalamazoonensis]AHG93130.1 hypothetical protein J421_5595 [Gemmatirosa kalamazoonensis]